MSSLYWIGPLAINDFVSFLCTRLRHSRWSRRSQRPRTYKNMSNLFHRYKMHATVGILPRFINLMIYFGLLTPRCNIQNDSSLLIPRLSAMIGSHGQWWRIVIDQNQCTMSASSSWMYTCVRYVSIALTVSSLYVWRIFARIITVMIFKSMLGKWPDKQSFLGQRWKMLVWITV